MSTATRKIVVNGVEQTIEAAPEMRLLDCLREIVKLTGTKEGCGEGECGACSVLRNGDVVNACLILVGQLADGDAIMTIEGIWNSGLGTRDSELGTGNSDSTSLRRVPNPESRVPQIVTTENFPPGAKLHPIQQAFIDCGATQCGICTPGMVIAAHALLSKNAKPTREEIALAIAGNLCRCTGYVKIIDAIERAAAVLRGEGR